MGRTRCQLDACGWQVGWIRRKCVETGPALRFCGGLGVDKPRSLGGRNKSETQCYHDLRRPGSAVRMFMRPFVWAECAQHIHVNVLPGCFQISRANPEATASEERVRPRNTLAPCGKKDNFGAPGTPGCSHSAVHVAFTNLLRMLAWIR